MAEPRSGSTFDPEAPLPGPPEPWRGSSIPEARSGAPFLMTEMIAAEPALTERIVRRLAADGSATALAALIRRTVEAGLPVRLTGCGTSEHAALGGTAILADGLERAGLSGSAARPVTEQAFEAALEPTGRGLLIAVSHEGGTWATNRAIAAAREAGARTALVTVGTGSPGAALAEVVVATGEQDRSWCHTVGYVSPLVAFAAVAAELEDSPLDPVAARDAVDAGSEAEAAAEAVASSLQGSDPEELTIVGSGTDRVAARELALKVEEGAHLLAVARDLETLLHGHLAAMSPATPIVLVLADRSSLDERVERAREALVAAAAIGMPIAAIVARDVDPALAADLTPAGRVLVDVRADLPAPVAALLATAIPLQLLTERLARARGVNPDLLHRDVAAYREAGTGHR